MEALFATDMSRVDDEVRTLLGPESMAAEKEKSGRRLDMIGWLIDLDAPLVTISDRNFNKTLHAFFSFDIVEPVTLHQVQVMTSLTSRYTQINVLMKLHVGALYQFQQSFPSHSARRRLPEAARVEVLLWRAFLLSLSVNPASFARPFRSFRAHIRLSMMRYSFHNFSCFGKDALSLSFTQSSNTTKYNLLFFLSKYSYIKQMSNTSLTGM